MPFEFKKMDIPGVVLITPAMFNDGRGYLAELYKDTDFKAQGLDMPFVQVNCSRSRKGVVRGLHYQLNPKAQSKLVFVTKGEIFDVAVDIRQGSPTFGRWVAEVLSEHNRRMLYIPAGFAHGLCVLSEEADIIYCYSCEYEPALERCIIWDDPDIKVDWPAADPILSPRDLKGSPLCEAENNFYCRSPGETA